MKMNEVVIILQSNQLLRLKRIIITITNARTHNLPKEKKTRYELRGGRKTDSLPCIYVLCSPLFLTKMSLGTLTFERKELSENEMIYGLTILKFVEKIGIYITHFNNW